VKLEHQIDAITKYLDKANLEQLKEFQYIISKLIERERYGKNE